ncbi:unnamed protein product [Sphacelaria rigidula]
MSSNRNTKHVTGIVHQVKDNNMHNQVKDVIEQVYQTNNMHNMSWGLCIK